MSEVGEFVVLARDAAFHAGNRQVRLQSYLQAREMAAPQGESPAVYGLCRAIVAVCAALPELPPGSIGPAGAGLRHLALALELVVKSEAVVRGTLLDPAPPPPYWVDGRVRRSPEGEAG